MMIEQLNSSADARIFLEYEHGGPTEQNFPVQA
jgi:hypothetical protein